MFEITLKFLAAVQKNNSTEWLHTYRDLYQQEKKRFSDFVESLLIEFQKINPNLEGQKPKDCIYRFNKDIRFSKDKKPYKENFWANFCTWGKKSWEPCFYFHLQPENKSFITAGVYRPSQQNENRVRAYLLMHFEERDAFLNDKKINKFFHFDEADHQYKTPARLISLIANNPEIKENLSTMLAEYWISKEYWSSEVLHNSKKAENILKQLAYFKDWTFTHHLTDEDVKSPKLYDEILNAYKLIYPVINFFERAYDWPEYIWYIKKTK